MWRYMAFGRREEVVLLRRHLLVLLHHPSAPHHPLLHSDQLPRLASQRPGISNASRVIYQSKVKVLKMMVVVVILFASFWMPLYAVNLRMFFGTKLNENDPELHFVAQTVIPIVQWLGSSNSCMNPIIYCFFSRKFRVGFADIVRRCARRTSPSLSRSYISYSVPYNSVFKGGGGGGGGGRQSLCLQRQSHCLQNRCFKDTEFLREKVRLREVMV